MRVLLKQTPMRRTVDDLMRTSMSHEAKARVEDLAMEQMEREMAECTFKPDIRPSAKYRGRPKVRSCSCYPAPVPVPAVVVVVFVAVIANHFADASVFPCAGPRPVRCATG